MSPVEDSDDDGEVPETLAREICKIAGVKYPLEDEDDEREAIKKFRDLIREIGVEEALKKLMTLECVFFIEVIEWA